MTTHPSRVDAWIVALLALPPIASAMVIARGEVVSGGLAIAAYLLVIVGLVVPLRYEVGDQLVIRYGRVRLRIPWHRVIGMTPTTSPLSSPALSLRRLDVKYRKPSGEPASVLISPVDRAAFVAACATASNRHRAAGETLAVRPESPAHG